MKRIARLTAPALAAFALAACAESAPDAESPGASMEAAAPAFSEVCQTSAGPDALAERPSPLQSTTAELDNAAATVCYGSPSARGREVMDALVPMDAPWRLGANEATAIHLTSASMIGEVAVDAGSYSLYAIPGAESWEIVVNGTAGRWGVPIDASVRATDIGSFTVTPEALTEAVEALTMTFEGGGTEATLVVDWEMTRIRIPVRLAAG